MKLIIVIGVLICGYACSRAEKKMYPDTQRITVENRAGSYHSSFEDKKRIEIITNVLSCRVKSPAVFIARFRIILENKSKAKTIVLVNAKRIKIDGITYELCENLEDVMVAHEII
ncbi:MAG TPA: hypothetical protein VK151_00060 [Fluviicola sp.]|nr:hypothetical protein [Fluviicola sp.]